MAVKVLDSKYLFRDKWIRVKSETYQTESGKIVTPYYVYEFTDWVAALPMTKEGKFILIKQYRHGLGQDCLEIPGGCVDPDDKDLSVAISRELVEETGYEFPEIHFLGSVCPNASTNSNLLHMFVATGGWKAGEQSLDQNEEIEVVEVDEEELMKLVRGKKIITAHHLTCILFALDHLKKIRI